MEVLADSACHRSGLELPQCRFPRSPFTGTRRKLPHRTPLALVSASPADAPTLVQDLVSPTPDSPLLEPIPDLRSHPGPCPRQQTLRGKVLNACISATGRTKMPDMSDASPQSDSGQTHDAATLEEYKSLRQEILSAQQSRLLILGLVSAALGVVLGILAPGRTSPGGVSVETVGLILFSQLFVLAACIVTVQRGQAIVGIAEYIRVFIEPEFDGIHWETRIRKLQSIHPRRRYKMGASRSFAAYYAALALSLGALGLYLTFRTWWMIPVGVFLLADLVPIRNLWRQRSFGWKFQWDEVRATEAP